MAMTDQQNADIAAFWEQNKGDPQAMMDAMTQFGVSAADLANATGQNVAAVGGYLDQGGATDGFGGYSGPTVYNGAGVDPNPAAQQSGMTAKQLADIKSYVNSGATGQQIINAMGQYGVNAADLSQAMGWDNQKTAQFLTGWGAGDGYGGMKFNDTFTPTNSVSRNLSGDVEQPWLLPGYKVPKGQEHLTPQVMRGTSHGGALDNEIQSLYRGAGNSAQGMKNLMDAMNKYGYSAEDVAAVTGSRINDVAWALQSSGAKIGFGGVGAADNPTQGKPWDQIVAGHDAAGNVVYYPKGYSPFDKSTWGGGTTGSASVVLGQGGGTGYKTGPGAKWTDAGSIYGAGGGGNNSSVPVVGGGGSGNPYFPETPGYGGGNTGGGGYGGTGSIYQPGQTTGSGSVGQSQPMSWGTQPAQQFNTPMLDALYNAQQQRMTTPAPQFDFQDKPGALTQAAAVPAVAPAVPQDQTGALTQAITGV